MINNNQSLEELVFTLNMGKGEFSLILVRCNYNFLTQEMLEKLRQFYPEIEEFIVKPSTKQLYSTIDNFLGDKKPSALLVLGLSSVENIEHLLVNLNSVREEFRKNFPFPIIFWVNGGVYTSLCRTTVASQWVNFSNNGSGKSGGNAFKCGA